MEILHIEKDFRRLDVIESGKRVNYSWCQVHTEKSASHLHLSIDDSGKSTQELQMGDIRFDMKEGPQCVRPRPNTANK